MSILVVSFMAVVFVALIAYTIHHDRTNVEHLRSFTPTCPNCGRRVRATNETEPGQKARLRDHFKECVF